MIGLPGYLIAANGSIKVILLMVSLMQNTLGDQAGLNDLHKSTL